MVDIFINTEKYTMVYIQIFEKTQIFNFKICMCSLNLDNFQIMM
ncbi:protein of unknown function [Xenorhabdus nematophila AN6/1]|nr:protein of unknown function [Xenorhabdus nematophila AN6/1]